MVEVEGDDLLFRQIGVDLVGEKGLLEFPHVALFRGEVEGLGDLLGDGASPLDDPPRLEILEEGPGHALHVEPLVLEEAGVLGGDEGLDHHLRDVFVFDDFSVFEEKLVDQLVIVRIDPRRDAGTVVLQGGDAGELFEEQIVEQAAPREGGADKKHEADDDDDRQQGASRCFSPAPGNTIHGGHGFFSSISAAVSSVSSVAAFFFWANLTTMMLTS